MQVMLQLNWRQLGGFLFQVKQFFLLAFPPVATMVVVCGNTLLAPASDLGSPCPAGGAFDA
jgi:hypothetical protein